MVGYDRKFDPMTENSSHDEYEISQEVLDGSPTMDSLNSNIAQSIAKARVKEDFRKRIVDAAEACVETGATTIESQVTILPTAEYSRLMDELRAYDQAAANEELNTFLRDRGQL
jgi:hypothetical protein